MFDIYDSGLGGLNDSDFGADADQSFTSGWDQGWDDRNFEVNTNQGFTTGPLGNRSFNLAELTQDQKNFMGNVYNTPDFGVTRKDLWEKTKDMEDKGSWYNPFDSGQEPTTQQEFNDYYRQLEQRKVGNWASGTPRDYYNVDPWQREIDYGTNRRGYNGPLRFG
jgi:hypothetical protein